MAAYVPEDDANQLLKLSEEVSRIAGALADLTMEIAAARAEGSAARTASKEVSVRSVDYVIRARRARGRYFSEDLFAEPAWDMMLDLLQAEIKGQRLSVSDICLSSGVPMTTALRWIATMVERGLLLKEADRLDGRRMFVKLDAELSAALRRYFADVVQAA